MTVTVDTSTPECFRRTSRNESKGSAQTMSTIQTLIDHYMENS